MGRVAFGMASRHQVVASSVRGSDEAADEADVREKWEGTPLNLPYSADDMLPRILFPRNSLQRQQVERKIRDCDKLIIIRQISSPDIFLFTLSLSEVERSTSKVSRWTSNG